MPRIILMFLAILSCSLALAFPLQPRKMNYYTKNIGIHPSCNATQTRQLKKALADTYEIVNVARKYVLANGPEDLLYKKYFGDGDYISVLGAFDGILVSNKEGVLLRCDNIDGNCDQEGWAGHWRGTNATSETVICDLSFEIRRPLEQFCGFGYTVSNDSASYYFATDLMHRLYHIPVITYAKVGHYADSYDECLELAVHNSTWTPFNTHTLQYFAADVYGQEVGAPGIGCSGESALHDHGHEPVTTTAPASTSAASQTTQRSSSAATTAASSCHTHADGEVHCV
ncbi:Antigen 1 [Hypsizygus marmoreus]|uniref:Antigen 1 n=1 Tax=Hypsizygus marmoreus TaxID=39966 RepID=A0A369J5Q1_HYPMA|nr:Antigen 1 [Hypsizygus marmoreus]